MSPYKNIITGLLAALFCFCLGALWVMDAPEIQETERDKPPEAVPTTCRTPAAETWEPVETGGFTAREDVPLDADLQAVLWEACEEYGVEYALALGLIEVESSFQEDAISKADCYGLMQLNPKYFPSGLSSEDNIRYGVAFLAEKITQYGDLEAALTAYNAGHDTGNREYAGNVLAAAERWRET